MRSYYIGPGPAYTVKRSPEVNQISQAHRKNIDDHLAIGKMVLAGPFFPGPDPGEDALLGLFIYDVANKEEALELAHSDPAVIAGRFGVDVLMWYGPTGITYEGRE